MSGWAEELISVLLSKGISASADTGSGYFSALEVQTILNLLEIIDNPPAGYSACSGNALTDWSFFQ